MIIDCDRCVVRGDACADCVVGVLLGMPGVATSGATSGSADRPETPSGARAVQFDAPECRALSVLADQGLVPRLRLVAINERDVSHRPVIDGGFSDVG